MPDPQQETNLVGRAGVIRTKALTPEQAAYREKVAARTDRLSEHGVRRGPNAPRDGTFGAKA